VKLEMISLLLPTGEGFKVHFDVALVRFQSSNKII
jgi:hypothetical protein